MAHLLLSENSPHRIDVAIDSFLARGGGQAVAFVALAGREFAGSAAPASAPPGVRRAAELSLITGRLAHVIDGARRWLAHSIDAPFPALVALGAPRGRSDDELAAALHSFRALLSDEVLRTERDDDPFLALAAASPSLQPLTATLRRIARTRLPVLLLGETGVGKEELARAIHSDSGRPGPLVAENCAALPEALLEAELFGVRRGAFTGATTDRKGRILEADGGTLMLDEVGDLPLALQAKLLRVLQEREVRPLGGDRAHPVDLRVIAATHQHLDGGARDGCVRQDLYYRLAGIVVQTPPLRQRARDLPYLVNALLQRLAADGLGPGRRLTPAGLAMLAWWPFPGNVRELDNVLRRAAALSPGPVIPAELLAPARRPPPAPSGNLEVRAILDALSLSGGVKSEAARRLGWTRQKLYRRLDALGLPSGPSRSDSNDNSTSRPSSAG